MGCSGSKDSGNDDQKIDSEFATVNISRFDDFFNNAKDLLSTAEDIRSGIQDSKDDAIEMTDAWQLKDPKYIDTVQVLFWAASAEHGGQIKNTNINITGEAPYVTMDASAFREENAKLNETFVTYLKTVVEGPGKLVEIVEKLKELAEQAPGLVKEGKDEIQNSSLEFGPKLKAMANLAKNCSKLPKQLVRCKSLLEALNTARKDMTELIGKFRELANKADEIGAKAHADKLYTPKEIFNKYHSGEKKTPKDIEAERKKKAKEAEDEKKKAKK